MKSKEEEYKEIFLAEALDNHEELNRLLTQLEKNPADDKAVHAIFRITHTLKGNALGMGFQQIGEMAHVVEDLFGEIRDGNIALSEELFGSIFRAIDVLGGLIESLKDGREVKYKGIKTKLEVLVRNTEQTTNPSKKETTQNKPKATTVKPASEKTTSRKRKKLATKPVRKKTDGSENTKVKTKKEENQENKPLVKPEEIVNTIIEEIKDSARPDEEKNAIDIEEVENKITFSDLVQVPVRKLDNLLNLVGELIIERDRIISSHAGLHASNEYSRLNRISSDLQYSVMDVRLVQVGFLFNKFHRVVRDAASVEQKKVTLKLEGSDTEIDRNILQIISDSLIHLIRNCVGHGIEKLDERKKLGKPEEGSITLSARNDNDAVIIDIKDDGQGMDAEKIKQKAISKGLLLPEMANHLSEQDIIMYIFEPGFSTMDQVNAISGRGVGMDVVKKALDSIGGNIYVNTKPGEGSTISLRLPSSMAVKGTLLFELDKVEYAIPLSYTEAVVSFYKPDIHKVGNGLVASHLGKTISIVFLKDLFKAETQENTPNLLQKSYDALHEETQLHIVIVSHNNRTVGFVVDKLLQQKEIVEKPLMKPVDAVKFISGVTILGNGNVCLVLNVATVISHIFSASVNAQSKKVLSK